MLLAIRDRRDRLEVGYGLEPILPDGLDGSVLRAMRPALRQGDYADALRAAAETLGTTVASAKHVALDASLPRRVHPSTGDSIPWPLIFGGFFVLLWLLRAAGGRGGRGFGGGGGGGFLSGLILGGMMGRSSWGGPAVADSAGSIPATDSADSAAAIRGAAAPPATGEAGTMDKLLNNSSRSFKKPMATPWSRWCSTARR